METNSFHERSRNAINDVSLQRALGRLKTGFVERRRKAFSEIDFSSLSEQGAAIRSAAVANIGTLAMRFESEAIKRGATVHWAEDAAAANRIILDLCKQNNVQRLVKSKSMITEEIQLNEALQKGGIESVETDLGEYIIQLRQERPSHIIAPAFHLNRDQIEESFRQHHTHLAPDRALDENRRLMHEARNVLREKFLNADAGLTGANMLIASDGSTVLVTNEGNADLCFSHPRHHIVVASIEKLIPDYRDAWVLLRLLARSATGQRSSVYTSFVRPPTANDPESDRRMHIVLLDNGRSHWLGTPLEEALRCIRCGACMNHCPVYEAIGGHAYNSVYPGPIGSVISPGLFGTKGHGNLASASSFCGQCDSVCPVKIPLTRLMRGWRDEMFKKRETGLNSRIALRLWSWLSLHPRLFGLCITFGRCILRILAHGQEFIRIPFVSGWTQMRDFPVPGRSVPRDVSDSKIKQTP